MNSRLCVYAKKAFYGILARCTFTYQYYHSFSSTVPFRSQEMSRNNHNNRRWKLKRKRSRLLLLKAAQIPCPVRKRLCLCLPWSRLKCADEQMQLQLLRPLRTKRYRHPLQLETKLTTPELLYSWGKLELLPSYPPPPFARLWQSLIDPVKRNLIHLSKLQYLDNSCNPKNWNTVTRAWSRSYQAIQNIINAKAPNRAIEKEEEVHGGSGKNRFGVGVFAPLLHSKLSNWLLISKVK